MVKRVALICRRPELVTDLVTDTGPRGLRQPIQPSLVVDSTGVGRPVVDLLRAEVLSPIAVTITGGDRAHDGRVPKRDLVSALQVLLQSGRIKIAPSLEHAKPLADELLRFRVKIDPVTAHDSYGAWRSGQHDDLVLAVACAVWQATRRLPASTLNPGSWPTIQR